MAPPVGTPLSLGWMEYKSSDGRPYFHNPAKKETCWTRPAELVEEEKKLEAAKADAQRSEINSKWKATLTAVGKRYWYNEMTRETTWDPPPGVNVDDAVIITPAKGTIKTPPRASSTKVLELPEGNAMLEKQPDNLPKSERLAAFKEMLTDKNVNPDEKWEDALKKLFSDPRFQAVKNTKERKAAFVSWGERRRKELKELEWKKKKQIKQDFIDLLKEVKASGRDSYSKLNSKLRGEPRWNAVESENERRGLMEEYRLEMDALERQERKERKDKAKAELTCLMDRNMNINFSTEPEDLTRWYGKDDCFGILGREAGYQFCVAYLEKMGPTLKAEQEKREEQRILNQKNRDNLRLLLSSRILEGKLERKCRWEEFAKVEGEEGEVKEVAQDQGMDVAEDVFDDFMLSVEEGYSKARKVLKTAYKSHIFDSGTDCYSFLEKARDDGKAPQEVLALFYFHTKERQARAKAQKRSTSPDMGRRVSRSRSPRSPSRSRSEESPRRESRGAYKRSRSYSDLDDSEEPQRKRRKSGSKHIKDHKKKDKKDRKEKKDRKDKKKRHQRWSDDEDSYD